MSTDLPAVPEPTVHTLPGGVRVVLDVVPGLHSATLNVWVDASQPQPERPIAGLAHAVEHMVFKAQLAASRRALQPSRFRAVDAIEATGGTLNALTDKETTCYYARVLTEDLPLAAEVLLNLTLQPLFRPDDLEVERRVILNEIENGEGNLDARFLERFVGNIWPKSPLAEPVIGTAESVSRIDCEALSDYHRQFYQPDHLVLSVAGGFDANSLLDHLGHLFSGPMAFPPPLHHSDTSGPALITAPPTFTPGHQAVAHPDPLGCLCVGGPAPKAGSNDRFTLALLDLVLGGGVDSRLFRRLRQEQGLVYHAQPFELLYRNAGLFGVFAKSGPDTLPQAFAEITAELDDLAENGISETELALAKRKIRGNLLLSMESTRYRAARNARNLIYHGSVRPITDAIEFIDGLGGPDVHRLCQQMLAPTNRAVVFSENACLPAPQAISA